MISLIEGALHTLEMNITGDEADSCLRRDVFLSGPKVGTEWTEAGLEGALFIHSQMLCILWDWAL